jgi:hypothetical protein
MENFNLARGKVKFVELMKELTTPANLQWMNIFSDLFVNVGVMESGKYELNENDKTVDLKDFVPSFKKLAYSVLFTVNNCQEPTIYEVLNNYKAGNYKSIMPQQSSTASDMNLELNNEIQSNSDLMSNYEVVTTEDGQEFLIDSLDLLEEMTEEEMSDEGLRSQGLFNWNTDLSSSSVKAISNPKSLARGKVIACDDGTWQIECPHTGSKNVYRISTSVYASVESDQPFYVNISLPDLEN